LSHTFYSYSNWFFLRQSINLYAGFAFSFITAPGILDPPIVTSFAARAADLTWSAPGQPNGIIRNYNIYTNDSLVLGLFPNTTTATVTKLSPYTLYVFSVEACTVVGCSRSAYSNPLFTLEDGKCTHTCLSVSS